MVSLLDADDIVLRVGAGSGILALVHYELTDTAGEPLATVWHDARRGLVDRLFFAANSGVSAANLDVADPSGALLFAIAKARGASGRLRLAVTLADGQSAGSASADRRRGDIVLYDASNREVGRLRRDSVVSRTLLAPDGTRAGSCSRQLRTLARAREPVTYLLRFTPPVAEVVRILTLSAIAADDLQRAL